MTNTEQIMPHSMKLEAGACSARHKFQWCSKSSRTLFFPNLHAKVSYTTFNARFKTWITLLGLDLNAYTPHSLSSGHISNGVNYGIPDQVVKQSGCWKSWICFEGYIGDKIALLAHVNKYCRATAWIKPASPLVSTSWIHTLSLNDQAKLSWH